MIRNPIRNTIRSAIRSAIGSFISAISGTVVYTPTLSLPFNSLRDSNTSDGRAAGWWNLFCGGVAEPDVFIDASTGAVSYGAHNLAAPSSDFSNAAWSASAEGVTRYTDRVEETATTNLHRFGFSITGSASFSARRMQIKAKLLGRDILEAWSFSGGVTTSIRFNLQTGTVALDEPGITPAPTISAADGDGYRTLEFPIATTNHTMVLRACDASVAARDNFLGEVGKGVYLKEARIVVGTAIFNIQTTTAPVYSLNPRVTFSRGSLATMINSAGNVAYGPHNLLLWSDAFNNAAWNANASGVTANATAAPDGQTTADKLLATTALEQKWFYQVVTVLTGGTYTASVFLKAGEYQYSNIRIFTGGKIADIGFDLSGSGSIFNTNTGSGTITSVGNGWYRCSVSGVTSGTTAITYINANRTAVLSESFAGDGTSGLFVWGAQLNIGPLQPYYPTTSAAYYGPRFTHDPATTVNIENYGANLVTNGDFSSSAGWTLGVGWAISGGLATKTAGTGDALTRSTTLTAGKVYRFTYTVSGASAGTCAAAITGGTQVTGSLAGTNGTRIEFLTAVSGNSTVGLTANGSFNGSIDNLSVEEYLGITSVVPATPLGFLPEEQRSNRLLWSEDFSNAAWVKSNVTVGANAAVAPDGNTTADTLTATAANGTVLQTITPGAGSQNQSVYLKRRTGTGAIQITADGSTWSAVTINSTTWTRCDVTQTAGAGAIAVGIRIVASGDAVDAWGAQHE